MNFEKPEYQLWLNRIETDELYKELMSIVSDLVLFTMGSINFKIIVDISFQSFSPLIFL